MCLFWFLIIKGKDEAEKIIMGDGDWSTSVRHLFFRYSLPHSDNAGHSLPRVWHNARFSGFICGQDWGLIFLLSTVAFGIVCIYYLVFGQTIVGANQMGQLDHEKGRILV